MRRRQAFKRQIIADPKYNNKVVAKLINILMVKGKKSVAESIVYNAFDIIKEKLNEEDARELIENLTGFFSLLAEWDRKHEEGQKKA